MAFIKDLSQLEIDFSAPSSPGDNPKMKKVFKKVDFPLSIMGDKAAKEGMMVVVVTVGEIKGFRSDRHTKEVTVEARSGGVYMKTGNLESQIAKAFSKKGSEHNSDHGDE